MPQEKRIGDRIRELREKLMLSQTAFVEPFEKLTQAGLSAIENGGGASYPTIKAIVDAYNVNIDWLVDGKGEMFKEVTSTVTKVQELKNVIKELEQGKSSMKVSQSEKPPPQLYQKPIPYYDIDVSASNIEMFSDNPELVEEYYRMSDYNECDFACRIYGDSMYPTYVSGQKVFCRLITDPDVINYGANYLVITADHRFVKRILPCENTDNILMVSDNKELTAEGFRKHPNFELAKDKILKMAIIKGSNKKELT